MLCSVIRCLSVSPFKSSAKHGSCGYCHFPDLLLIQRKSYLNKLYRAPLDWLEEPTTGKLKCDLHL